MKIVIAQGAFLPVPPLQGGAVEKAWYALGREFARQGHSVLHIGRQYQGLPEHEYEGGVEYRRIPGFSMPSSLLRLKWRDLLYSLRVCRELPEADILVTHTFWLPMLERRKSRGSLYIHAARFPKGQFQYYPRRAFVQTVSQPIRDAILREIPDRESGVRVVPYPISPGYLAPRPVTAEPVLLYVGRLHPEKGVHLLIDAFRLASAGTGSWRLRIVGPWEVHQGGGGRAYLDRLRNMATGLPVDIAGPIFDEAALVAEYRRAAIFAYPSLAERGETFGLAVLEAMAAGAAPLVSALACFRDFVCPGVNGQIFDHTKPDAAVELAKSISAMIAMGTGLDTLRLAAWETAQNYGLPAVAKLFLDDFTSICRARDQVNAAQ